MTTLYFDTETFSEESLKRGTHRYAERGEIMLVAWAFDDDDVEVEDFDPIRTQRMIDAADTIVVQNSYFDRTQLSYNGVVMPVEKIEDTMVMALAHSLPGGLDKLCDVLQIPQDKAKIKDGKKLINLFCKPRPKRQKVRRFDRSTHPKEWADFVEYARYDVISMRACHKKMPRWNMTRAERMLWILDQKINDRGVCIDLELARGAMRAATQAQAILAERVREMTGDALLSSRQRAKFLEYVEERFELGLTDLKKGTIVQFLKQETDNLDPEIRELMENRQQASSTSSAKYAVLVGATSTFDDRLRGILQFCGASRTGRWGGRLFQPQNLPRPTLKQKMINMGIVAIKSGCEALLFDNVMELLASACRGSLIAPKGKKLVVADLSNIEGRVLAWLAREDWKVKAFKDFDKGIGHDLYVLAYSRAYGVTPEEVLHDKEHANGVMRLIGKVMELALGYGGAKGAFMTMGLNYGLELPEDTVIEIVKKWRAAHPATTTFWWDVDYAFRLAIRNPGEKFKVGLLTFDRVGAWVRIRLPSGRYLCYPRAKENDEDKIVYEGVDQYTKQWKEIETYGPKIVENIVQAVSRDLLAEGMKDAENMEYEVVLHVHDELITEVDDNDRFTASTLSGLMAKQRSWTLGLPLAAAGFETHVYRKG